jgi:hypothetical protein
MAMRDETGILQQRLNHNRHRRHRLSLMKIPMKLFNAPVTDIDRALSEKLLDQIRSLPTEATALIGELRVLVPFRLI